MLQGYNPRGKAGHGRYNQIKHLNCLPPNRGSRSFATQSRERGLTIRTVSDRSVDNFPVNPQWMLFHV